MSRGLAVLRDTVPAYPTADRGCVVVWGLLGAYPFGGMTWQVLHYLVGLRLLGFDVWYVEDSDRYVFDAVSFGRTRECTANIAFMKRFLDVLGLGERWVFRLPKSGRECVGSLDYEGLLDLYRQSDAVFNLCGAQEARDDHDFIACRVYVETDPVESQVRVASGDREKLLELQKYQHLFTYGERLGSEGCRIPDSGLDWRTTRPPVISRWWSGSASPAAGAAFTTVAKWEHQGKDVSWAGERWRWSKHHEFRNVIGLPRRVTVPLEIAVSSITERDRQVAEAHGWRLVPSASVKDPERYRDYIRASLGEFTVAKEQYVAPVSGWFSDRSVCYLAASRPVVTQETGFSTVLPTGYGLLPYTDEDSAVAALEEVASNYALHAKAALAVARECFEAEVVLRDMIEVIGL